MNARVGAVWMRRQRMIIGLLAIILLGGAGEQDRADCLRGATEKKLLGCTAVIDDKATTVKDRALALTHRGIARLQLRDAVSAKRDLDAALALDPGLVMAMAARGTARLNSGDTDGALADLNRAAQRGHKSAQLFIDRGRALLRKGNADQAIDDFNLALGENPKSAVALANRGGAFAKKDEFDRAIADYEEAIRLGLRDANLHYSLAVVYLKKKFGNQAIYHFEQAILLKQNFAGAYNGRGEVYEQQGRKKEALEDYRIASGLPVEAGDERGHAMARANFERLNKAMAEAGRPEIPAGSPNAVPPPIGRRIALVIGNSRYAHASVLSNPESDARLIAAALRRLGFEDVRERLDLRVADLNRELVNFGNAAVGADWAVVYFAGHGIEVNGQNYLLPVDAELATDRNLEEEAVVLGRVLSKLEPARELRLVILDACRTNPFVTRLARGRSVHRETGLAPLKDTGGVLVAYAARDGTVALDGTDGNSPYARALLEHLEVPNIDIDMLFRRVRASVLKSTNSLQEPWTYGALPPRVISFKP